MKRIICIWLIIIMVFTMGTPAFAVDKAALLKSTVAQDAAEGTDTTDSPFDIEIKTDKEKYRVTGVASVTVKVTNISNETVENVSTEALFDGLVPVGTSSTLKAEVQTLKQRGSLSFSYNAMIASNQKGLSFFQRIILFFKYLFKRIISVTDNGFDDGRAYVEESKTISFGKYDTENRVRVWYAQNGSTATSEEYEKLIEGVDIDEVYEESEEDISFNEERGIKYINNIIVINFDWECSNARKAEIVNSINGKVVGGSEGLNELQVEIERKTIEELEKICDELNKNEDIYAFIDYISGNISSIQPNDPWSYDNITLPFENWNDPFNAPNNNWNMVAVKATGAWNYDSYLNQIIIGVIDSGFSMSNPDLELELVSRINTPSNHGTHVAGIIGATANNKKGVTGIVWKKKLLAYDARKDENKEFKSTEIYNGLKTLVEKGCKVINLSVSSSGGLSNCYQSYNAKDLKNAGMTASQNIAQLLKKGHDFIVVQSSGNGAADHIGVDAINGGYFCSVTNDYCYSDKTISKNDILSRIIVVANAMIDDSGSRKYVCAQSSNGNNMYVDLAAPGTNILSTVMPYEVTTSDGTKETWYYKAEGGTSMAAPLVAGVAGLVWSVDSSFTGAKVKDIVIKSAREGGILVKDDPNSPTTGDFYMVNAQLAVEEALRRTYTTCTLTGKAVDVMREVAPLADVDILIKNTKTGKSVTARTDKDGKFSVEVPVGKFTIEFTKAGYGVSTIETAEITGGTADVGVAFMIIDDGQFNVFVKDEKTKQPIPGVKVDIFVADSDNPEPFATTTTDTDGLLSCTLPEGEYRFVLSHERYKTYTTKQKVKYGEICVLLSDILLRTKDATISVSGTVMNKDTNQTISGVIVDAYNEQNDTVITTYTDENGKFSFDLQEGAYRFVFLHGDYKERTINQDVFDEVIIEKNMKIFLTPKGSGDDPGGNDENIVDSGTCGENVTWKLINDGTLIIRGNGAMTDYNGLAPWYKNCSTISYVIIGNGITSIGDYAFDKCTNLTSVTMPNSIISIGQCAFGKCGALKKINIPNSVTNIGRGAFGECIGLTSVIIPDSVTNIGPTAFAGCSNLAKINIPDGVTSIGEGTFEYCNNLIDISLGTSLLHIGIWAFYDCTSLKSIIIPNGVKTLGNSAFRECTSLTNVSLPDSVTSIDSYAFKDCDNLTDVYYNGKVENWCSIEFRGMDAHPNSYAQNIYFNGTQVTELKIPSTITQINDYTFYNFKDVISVSIPDSVTSIGNRAFYNCANLTEITIGKSVKSVGEWTFYNCNALQKIYYNGNVESWCKIDYSQYGSFYAHPNSYAQNIYFNGKQVTELNIPSTITQINDYTFYNFKDVTSVTISDTVIYISNNAFNGCPLKNVIMGVGMTMIPYSLINKDYLETFVIGRGLTDLTYSNTLSGFSGCTKLTNITIPNTLTSIQTSFEGCNSLKSVYYNGDIEDWCNIQFRSLYSNPNYYAQNIYFNNNIVENINIPNTITKINDYTFYNFNRLSTVVLPDSIVSIGNHAFYNCCSLNSIIIPNSVTSIGDYAFFFCGNLQSVTIPRSVISIGYGAFDKSGLKEVHYKGTKQDWHNVQVGVNNYELDKAAFYFEY